MRVKHPIKNGWKKLKKVWKHPIKNGWKKIKESMKNKIRQVEELQITEQELGKTITREKTGQHRE